MWQTPEALTDALTTELNSITDGAFCALSGEIDNESGLYQYMDLELHLAAQGSARAAGAWVGIMIAVAVDPAPTYPDTADLAFADQLTAMNFDAATTARTLTKYNLGIPPFKFKLYGYNKTGQTLATTLNTLKRRRHNEQGV